MGNPKSEIRNPKSNVGSILARGGRNVERVAAFLPSCGGVGGLLPTERFSLRAFAPLRLMPLYFLTQRRRDTEYFRIRSSYPRRGSNKSLIEHGVGDFYEARDVGAGDEVAGRAPPFGRGCFARARVNISHNVLELGVGFLEGPGDPLAILRHLESGDGDLIA